MSLDTSVSSRNKIYAPTSPQSPNPNLKPPNYQLHPSAIIMGHQETLPHTPSITHAELPPASYYQPYPTITSPQPHPQYQEAQLSHPSSNSARIALQQNDKSGEVTVPISLLGRYQAPVECPACSRRTVTNVKHKNGRGTHTWAGILFLTTGVGVVVPYVLDYFKNVQHRCGRCGVVLATAHFSSGTEAHLH